MDALIVVIAGSPVSGEAVEAALRDAGFSIRHETRRDGLVPRLADLGAALVLVSQTETDWQAWVTAIKTSPATRRIPVLVVGEDGDAPAATTAGADETISPDMLDAIPEAALRLARVVDERTAAALDCQCDEPLPAEAQEAVARFNAGEYYRQHDLFEALWMGDPRPVRMLYQGVLQVGIAYHQIELGNWRGASKMIVRALGWLNRLPDACQGIDIAALRADALAVRAELERVGDGGLADFDRTLLKPVPSTAPKSVPPPRSWSA